MCSHQLNSKNNGPFGYQNCVLLSVAVGSKDRNGLKLEKIGAIYFFKS